MEEGFGDGPATSGDQRDDDAAVDSPAQNDPRPLAPEQHLPADIVPEAAEQGDTAPIQADASRVTQDSAIPAQSQPPIQSPPIDNAPPAATAQAEQEPGVTGARSKADVIREADHRGATGSETAAFQPQQSPGQQQPPLLAQRSVAVPQFVAPSSYLRPLAINRSAMATAVAPEPSPVQTVHDRDQVQGLVGDASVNTNL